MTLSVLHHRGVLRFNPLVSEGTGGGWVLLWWILSGGVVSIVSICLCLPQQQIPLHVFEMNQIHREQR